MRYFEGTAPPVMYECLGTVGVQFAVENTSTSRISRSA